MNSVRTNPAALGAAQALAASTTDLAAAQARVSSGLKVAAPKDDGATFAVAQKMRSEIAGWQAAADSLSRGSSLLDVTLAAASQISDLLNQLRQQVVALSDPSLDQTNRSIVKNGVKKLIEEVDQAAKSAVFDGKRPLADTLTPTTVTTTQSSVSVPNPAVAPPLLSTPIQNVAGAASQTFVRDGGPFAGRVDLYLDAYSLPDVLEIWQNGNRVAATGQGYAPGGGDPGPGQPVSDNNVVSFDYDPNKGRQLEFRFNQNRDASGSVWSVDGLVLEDPTVPASTPTVTTTTATVYVSSPTTYQFVRSPDGATEPLDARPLTANALGLDRIDLNDPVGLMGAVDSAVTTANDAAAYFGERAQAFSAIQTQNGKVVDALQTGIGNLVDADMAKEAAALQADQVKQQLGVKALAIANAAPQWMLKLLGG